MKKNTKAILKVAAEQLDYTDTARIAVSGIKCLEVVMKEINETKFVAVLSSNTDYLVISIY